MLSMHGGSDTSSKSAAYAGPQCTLNTQLIAGQTLPAHQSLHLNLIPSSLLPLVSVGTGRSGPSKLSSKKRNPPTNKRLLLAIFTLCVQSQTPVLRLCSEDRLTERLRKSHRYMGQFDTSRLDAVTLSDLHNSIQISTDAYLSQATNTNHFETIADTGYIEACTNDKSDFEPGSLTKMSDPRYLGGIAGEQKIK